MNRCRKTYRPARAQGPSGQEDDRRHLGLARRGIRTRLHL